MSSKDNKSNLTTPYRAAKALGYDGFPAFLAAYGLYVWDPDQVEEGKEILRGMGYNVL